jgi:hypothetical protein
MWNCLHVYAIKFVCTLLLFLGSLPIIFNMPHNPLPAVTLTITKAVIMTRINISSQRPFHVSFVSFLQRRKTGHISQPRQVLHRLPETVSQILTIHFIFVLSYLCCCRLSFACIWIITTTRRYELKMSLVSSTPHSQLGKVHPQLLCFQQMQP